ncbi:GMC family oxidoreductase [Dactylosporangium sp. AC04546]|uniref:FAD-dependent oxidoreductase n=1 Tax=Dactylosporangium sp. AC04546 TaxID=2862460 RepID=UPI001EE06F9B|nr:GMC family oxidoreductase [Dactylosporangium sp. AC04546]WVK83133.1 GMC family oxidoreductase [Dactylosporangium sp. AC04546]
MRYDVVVIGSGFGGSVAALRLAEKGYSVAVLEAGRRFADDEFPKTSWDSRRFLWAPALGCYGIQRITMLRNVLVLSGAGVGGGSLVYANTLYRPLQPFYDDPQWKGIADWRAELAPFYDQAERMLGVTTYRRMTRADVAIQAVAERMGVAATFHQTPVGVYFGRPDVDPYFGGAGPVRQSCEHCGSCMTGCRVGAKNTLVKNYLYLAERLGAVVHPLTTVTAVRPDGDGYAIETRGTGRRGRRQTFTAGQVVFAAGALGTQRLLHQCRAAGLLPGLSGRLGALTRTNSESIVGARSLRKDVDFTDGVAITSSFHPDANTHIEPVRYGPGSNAMGLLQTVLTDGGPLRPLRWFGAFFRHPVRHVRALSVRRWSHKTIIALVMQSADNSLDVHYRRSWTGRRRLTTTQGHGQPNPAWIPAGNHAVRLLAEEIGGLPGGSWSEVFNIPVTAHILGGAAIGASADGGVVDAYHRVFGHPGLHVVDGAAVSANLGVNPSLTITAQAERAMSMWPNKGEPDPRPSLGAAYTPVAPVRPANPAVPEGAPGALRLAG